MGLTNEDVLIISNLMDAKLKPISCQISGIKEDMKQLKTDVSLLQTDVSQLKTDTEEMKMEIKQLKTDVTQLKTDVSQPKTDVTQLKSDVSLLQEDMKQLKPEIFEIKRVQEKHVVPVLDEFINERLEAYIKFNKNAEKIESLGMDMEIVKSVLNEHSKQLRAKS